MKSVLRTRDFLLLWVGSSVSLLGDQFTLIAMPWLVLQLTGDPLALGLVLALASLPRALLMLIGGAVTDRYSPRTILLVSDLLRALLTALLMVLVASGAITLWMIYVCSVAFGIVSGFAIPAGSAMIPTIVRKAELEAANSLSMGGFQLVSFVGPALAGGAIAWFAHASGQVGLGGIAFAFAIDAATFLVSALALWALRAGRGLSAPGLITIGGLLAEIGEGVRHMWHDPFLRLLFITVSVSNFLVTGPLLVGIPVLSKLHLAEGVSGFGVILSGYGGGNLLGIILAGALPKLSGPRMRQLVVALLAGFGLGIAALGWIVAMWSAFAVMFVLGVGNGYLSISLIAQLQRRTPQELLGRIMSMLMLANFGLAPLSQALAGVISRGSLFALFVGAGALFFVLTVWIANQPALRLIDTELAVQPAPAA